MAIKNEMAFNEWVNSVPSQMCLNPQWKSTYYRLAMYLYDLVWVDCVALQEDFRGRAIVNQLIRSAGSICANVEEAYGRGVGTPDYIRIMRIALGEARETQGWYLRSRHILPVELLGHRLDIVNQVIALLVNTISHQRRNLLNS